MNEVRDRIMNVASRLFFEQGYNLTGINQIIDEADIARGSLYNHFKSKHDLLMAYLEEAQVKWLNNLQIYLQPFKDPKKKVLALFDHRIDLQRRNGFSGCRFVKIGAEVSRDEKQVFDFLAAHKRKYRNVIAEVVNQLGLPAQHDREILTETIFLFIEGASAIGALEKSEAHLKEAQRLVKKML